MPRYGNVPKRKLIPEAVTNSTVVTKFISKLIFDGKKSKAEKIVHEAFAEIKKKLSKEPLVIFETAISNVMPLMEVKSRRVGGATYQVPIEVPKDRSQSIALKWIRDAARERSGKSMVEKLSNELIDAFNNVGGAKKKQEDMHKTAEANKAFSHFRW